MKTIKKIRNNKKNTSNNQENTSNDDPPFIVIPVKLVPMKIGNRNLGSKAISTSHPLTNLKLFYHTNHPNKD